MCKRCLKSRKECTCESNINKSAPTTPSIKIRNIYRIEVQYYTSGLSAYVTLMNGKSTRFMFSEELRRMFEKEMDAAIKNIHKED